MDQGNSDEFSKEEIALCLSKLVERRRCLERYDKYINDNEELLEEDLPEVMWDKQLTICTDPERKISKIEFLVHLGLATPAQQREIEFKIADINGDGSISENEFLKCNVAWGWEADMHDLKKIFEIKQTDDALDKEAFYEAREEIKRRKRAKDGYDEIPSDYVFSEREIEMHFGSWELKYKIEELFGQYKRLNKDQILILEGVATHEELELYAEKQRKAVFSFLDADQDGYIGLADFQRALGELDNITTTLRQYDVNITHADLLYKEYKSSNESINYESFCNPRITDDN